MHKTGYFPPVLRKKVVQPRSRFHTSSMKGDCQMSAWDKTDGTQKPSLESISAYVNSPLWEQLHEYMEEQYQIAPVLEYSRCSMQRGWNVKYKKAGRTLCTLYPMEGYFIALVVIGERERAETELALPFFTEYLQHLYEETRTSIGQKWLMIHVTNLALLEDVRQCIAIRRGIRKGQPA